MRYVLASLIVFVSAAVVLRLSDFRAKCLAQVGSTAYLRIFLAIEFSDRLLRRV
jgi:hypothetical protein